MIGKLRRGVISSVLGLFVLFTSLPSSALAADGAKITLISELDVNLVCFKNPIEEGWKDVYAGGRQAVDNIRILINENSTNNYNGIFGYRVIRRSSPCFWEFLRNGKRGIRNDSGITVPLTYFTHFGYDFPFVFPEEFLIPAIDTLMKRCMDHNLFRKGEYDSRRNRFPATVKQLAEENCRNSVTEILLDDAGVFYAVSNKNKSNSEQAFALVQGDIIYNGKVINPWPQK